MKKNKILILILKERKIFITAFISGVIIFFLYLLFFYTPLFNTSAKLFIRNIPQQSIITDFEDTTTFTSESGFSNPLFNMVQIIESDKVANKVYKNISNKYPKDLNKIGVNSYKDWLKKYSKLIKAQIKPSTDIIVVSLNWSNKDNADNVLFKILKEFKNVNLEIRKTVETEQRVYIDTQLDDIASQLDNIREQIKNYKVENRAIDITNETTELTRARVDLQKEVELLKSKILYYDKKLADLSAQVGFKDAKSALRATSIGDDEYLIQLSQNLATAQQKYAELSSKFTDNYPEVISVKNEIASLKKNIEARKKESIGEIKVDRGIYDKPSQEIISEMARVQAEKSSTKAQLTSLINGIENLSEQESYLPKKVLGLEELQKQESALAIAYENIKQKQLEAIIKENEIVDNIVILNNPSKPKFVYSFLALRFIGLLGISFLVAFAIAIIKEDFENRWLDTSEIEEVTGVKVLGTIPWLKNTEIIEKDKKYFIQKSDSILGISYGEIATNIVRSSYLHEAQAITFVSTVTSRGKSFIIPNVTATLARLNKSVILIVTDYEESQKLINNFGIKIPPKKMDMLDVIERINLHLRISKTLDTKVITQLLEEAFVPIFFEGDVVFQLLFANKNVNMYDYVATRGFYTIIDFLKQYYEFVLIDTPVKPLIFPEFSAISNVSDAVIIVSAMETNRDGLIKTIDKFEKAETKVLGVIAREENQELERFFISQLEKELNNESIINK